MYCSYALVSSLAVAFLAGVPAQAQSAAVATGRGCTTATMIDWDCDGYGPGSPRGPDADDSDAAVNTAATALARYGNTGTLLAHLGYTPLRLLFIATNGSDATGQVNNESLPFASWNGLAGLIRPGDAVIWRAGTYPMSASIQLVGGTSINPVLYMAYPGEKAILDWSAHANDGIHGDSQSYWTLDGIIMKGSAYGYGLAEVQFPAVYNVTVRNVEVTGFYDSMFFMNNMHNFLIERNYFHDLDIGGEHNLYLGCNPDTCSNFVLRNNIIAKPGLGGGHNVHLNGNFGTSLFQGNILYDSLNQCFALQTGVNHSTFENNICFTANHTPVMIYDYYQNSNTAIVAHDQNYNVFRNNTFYYDGMNYSDGSTDCSQQLVWVRDDSGGYGSVSNPGNVAHDLGHNTWDNNIWVNACADSPAMLRYDTDFKGAGGLAWLATDTWRNNIFYATNRHAQAFLVQGNYAQSASTATEAFSQFQSGNQGGATNSTANPLLVAANPAWYNSPQNFNLQVQTGSPAIGVGLATDAPAVDITGVSRGGTPDIGAYQFLAAGAAHLMVSGFSCTGMSLYTRTSSTCTVTLSSIVPAGGAQVSLFSNNPLLLVPASVTVAAGAAWASFTATAGRITSSQVASITATVDGVSQSVSLVLSSGEQTCQGCIRH